jgi:hypothetical protein
LAWFFTLNKKRTFMKKLLLSILWLSFFATISQAQSLGSDYKTALGVKIYPGALSVKHFIKSNVAVEGLGYFYNYGFRLTGLYEIHGNINGAPGLKWYVGPGAHIGTWNDQWKKDFPTRQNGLQLGIDGVLGLDYKFNGAPINLSIDWQPSFNLVGYNYFEGGWGGLGIRYTF